MIYTCASWHSRLRSCLIDLLLTAAPVATAIDV